MDATAEIDLMDWVDTVPWGPSEDDELDVLDGLFTPAPETSPMAGAFLFRVGSLAPDLVKNVLTEAQKHVGISGRPNKFTREYAERHGDAFLRAAWCDMFVTYVSRHANAPAMLPAGDRAYTPWHAGDFAKRGRAYAGTVANLKKHAKPGAVIFFDWGGSNDSSRVDHVGICLRQLGDGRIVVIEGNTSDTCALRVRSADVVAVVCVPDYAAETKPAPAKPSPPSVRPQPSTGVPWPYKPKTLMRRGWLDSAGVKRVQTKVNAMGYRPKLGTDGDFGRLTEAGVRWAQRKLGVGVDGIVGPQTWRAMFG